VFDCVLLSLLDNFSVCKTKYCTFVTLYQYDTDFIVWFVDGCCWIFWFSFIRWVATLQTVLLCSNSFCRTW